ARVVASGELLAIDALPYSDVIDGRELHGFWSLRVAPFGDGVLVVSRDVTSAVAAQRQAEETNRLFDAVQELAHIGVFFVEGSEEQVWFSDELRRIFGIGLDAPLPNRDTLVQELFDVNERVVIEAAQHAAETEGPVTFETAVRRADGAERRLLVH